MGTMQPGTQAIWVAVVCWLTVTGAPLWAQEVSRPAESARDIEQHRGASSTSHQCIPRFPKQTMSRRISRKKTSKQVVQAPRIITKEERP